MESPESALIASRTKVGHGVQAAEVTVVMVVLVEAVCIVSCQLVTVREILLGEATNR